MSQLLAERVSTGPGRPGGTHAEAAAAGVAPARRRTPLRAVLLGSVCAGLLALGVAGTGPSPIAGQRDDAARPGVASENGRYILRLAPGTSHAATSDAVEALGGRVLGFQDGVGTVVVAAPASAAGALADIGGVTAVSPDGEVVPQSLGYDPRSYPGSLYKVTQATGAIEMWRYSFTGRDVDVAVIDTGVAPIGGLADRAKVVVGPDLSFESQNPATRHLDTYGHGSAMAGIIAGRESGSKGAKAYMNDTSNFTGMAPDARIVSLKLADRGGAVDVSQMVAAIDWVVQHKNSNGLNIKVLNISYGSPSRQDAQSDPLSWAAEVAWKSGITVVASAGNDGESMVGLASPAYNPWIIAVGAADTRGTETYADDVVPSFSERGVDGGRGPDLVAPGVAVVSLGVPGSQLAAAHSSARIGNNGLRGSGTSQSAAVVSGAAALILSKFPTLPPDGVKAVLTSSATKLSGVSANAQGAGELNLRSVPTMAAPTNYAQSHPNGHGEGSIDKTRGGQKLMMDGVPLEGEIDIFGNPWTPQLSRLAGLRQAWTSDGRFNGTQWTGSGFVSDPSSWAGKTWQGGAWEGKTWQGKTWQGKTWQGKTWQVGQWQGNGWSSAKWGTAASTDPSWVGRTWSSAGWE